MKILLAIDGSSYGDAKIEEVAHRPWPPQTEIKIITAAETPILPGMEPWEVTPAYSEELEKAIRESAQSVIHAALPKLNTTQDKTLKISSEIIRRNRR
jgi:hypothetical protein